MIVHLPNRRILWVTPREFLSASGIEPRRSRIITPAKGARLPSYVGNPR